MKYVSALSAVLMAGALGNLGACGNGGEAPAEEPQTGQAQEKAADGTDAPAWQDSVAGLQKLADEDFSIQGGQEADISGLSDALPDLVSVSWDEKTFDEKTGATAFSDFAITINTDPAFGLKAGDAEVWGLNTGLIAARLNGERLEEEGLAFNRFEARDVSYFGIAGALGTVFEGLEEEIEEESGDPVEVGIDTFEATISEMVLSNMSLRPYELVAASDSFFADIGLDDEEMSEEDRADQQEGLYFLRLAQQAVAVGRTFSVEAAGIHDIKVRVAVNQPGMTQTIEGSSAFYGYEDLNGFDLGRAVVVDRVQSQFIEMNDKNGDLSEAGWEEFNLDQVETTAFMSYEDIKLDKLAGLLARSEFPSMEERDLLSLGRWQARDYSLQLNDGDIFSVERIDLDADTFAWLIPEKIGLEMSGAELDAEAVGQTALAFIPEEAFGSAKTTDPASEDGAATGNEGKSGEEVLANLRTAVGKLDEHGLSTIPFNVSANWSWGADTGETVISLDMASEGFGEGAASMRIRLPDYAGVQKAYEAEDREAAFRQAFEEAFAFGGARLYEADDGGYDKLFAYVNDIAKLYPQEGWGAMLGNMDAQQIRNFIANMIRSIKGAAAQEFPPAGAWLESIAAYYQASGGSLEIMSAPSEPVTPEYFETVDVDQDPEQFVEKLGLSVTHKPE